MEEAQNKGRRSIPPRDVVPKEVVKEVKVLLKDLKAPTINDTPHCLRCRVAQRLEEGVEKTPGEALRAELADILEVLKAEPSNYGAILYDRYWLGMSVSEVRRKENLVHISDSGYFANHERAVERFAFLIWQKEQICKQSAEGTAISTQAATPTFLPERQAYHFSKRRLIVTGALVLLLTVGIVAYLPISFTSLPCVEVLKVESKQTGDFARNQGVTVYKADNTDGAVLNNNVRAMLIDQRGVWFAYMPGDTAQPLASSVGLYNKTDWRYCDQGQEAKGKNVNALALDASGTIWAATEHNGVLALDKTGTRRYRLKDGLPSDMTYGLVVDARNDIWVGTWEGVAKFNRKLGKWEAFYNKDNQTIFDNHVHAIAFDSSGNTWVGHIDAGLSVRRADGSWEHLTKDNSDIGGNGLRHILVRNADTNSPESIWFATGDGGVTKFEQGKWSVYRVESGLPDNDVRALAVDKYRRVWAATAKGIAYFDGSNWITYTTLPSLSVAFGPPCPSNDCPYDDDHIWTGTAGSGLTHSRIPYPDQAIDVVSVSYPKAVKPGEKFRPTIVVRVLSPYTLDETRGDFLSHFDEQDEARFGTAPLIAVKGVVQPNELFTFEPDIPFQAPELPAGEKVKSFTSTWRVWMYGRYVGSPISIIFKVTIK